MKIQILGSPRSGTTSFYVGLLDSVNYTVGIFEPINPYGRYDLENKSDEIISNHISKIKKTDMNVVEKNVLLPFSEEETEKKFKFYSNYLKNFDQIILIIREDIEDQAKSYMTAMKTNIWHSPYKDVATDYEDLIPTIQKMNNLLHRLSKDLGVPLLKYEMLYSGNLDYLNKVVDTYNFNFDDDVSFYVQFSPDRRHRSFT